MSFRFATIQILSFAGLLFGSAVLARAQSAGSGQQILFSSPDGASVSNSLLPSAQAPVPQELPDDAAQQSPLSLFDSQLPAQRFPAPSRVFITPQNSQDSM